MMDRLRAQSAYNRWMNSRLYDTCARLTDEQRKQDLGAFFKSIHGTLNHLLLADRIWMGRFTGQPYQATSLAQELYSEFDELRHERELEDARIDTWVTSLSESDLTSVLKFLSVLSPQPRQYPLWFAVTHLFNHQTHHRGQITTLLTQLGIDPGATDLLLLPQYQPT